MRTRKYPSKKKTTTIEGYREYKKLQMQEYRRRKKSLAQLDSISKLYLEKILAIFRQSSEYHKMAPKQRADVEKELASLFSREMEELKRQLAELSEEARQYARMQVREAIEQAFEQVEKERKQIVETEVKRLLEPLVSLPYEQRVRIVEKLLDTLWEFYAAKKFMAVAVLADKKEV